MPEAGAPPRTPRSIRFRHAVAVDHAMQADRASHRAAHPAAHARPALACASARANPTNRSTHADANGSRHITIWSTT